jgi:hypothetical protein
MSVFGIDYAWGRPGVTALRKAGVKFVCRYLSHDTSGKNLTRAEAEALSNAGVWIVVVWESGASRALKGRAAGASDAAAAAKQAKDCGMPGDRPIYFAVDFDATSGQQAAINAYLDGAASVLGRERVGLYGGYGPVKRALDGRHASWAWQTYAWSRGLWDGRAQLQQYSNDHTINGVGLDYDRAVKDDYGQWRVGVSPKEADMDPATRVPVPDYYAKQGNFSHEDYPAGFLWVGAVNESRKYGKAILAGQAAMQAALGELTKTVASLATNPADVDADALAAKVKAAMVEAIESIDVKLDVPDAPADPADPASP